MDRRHVNRIVFFSNFLNNHQLPLCLALDRLTGCQFTFEAIPSGSSSAPSDGLS